MKTLEYAEKVVLQLKEKDAIVLADWLKSWSDHNAAPNCFPKGKSRVYAQEAYHERWCPAWADHAQEFIRFLIAFKKKL